MNIIFAMLDKNPSIPNTEPPPHPDGKSNNNQYDEKLQHSINQPQESKRYQVEEINESQQTSDALVNNPLPSVSAQPQQPQSNSTQVQGDTPSVPPPQDTVQYKPPKKRSKIFLIIGILIILGTLIFLALKLRSTGPSLLGKKGEIIWWGVQHEENVYRPLIEEFEKQNPNLKVVYQKQSPQDYRERLTNALAAGRGPDIFEIHNTWPHMFKTELAPLPASVMSQEEFSRLFYPIIVSDLTLQNGPIAVPLEYDAITLYINEDIFASSLQKPPTTWDELRNLVDPENKGSLTIREKSGGKVIQSGIALGETVNVDHWPEVIGLMFYQNRVNPARPTNDLAGQVFTFYNEFKKLGWNTTLPSSTIAFSRGNVAMYIGPSRRASEISRSNPNLRFRTVRLPQLPKNAPTDPDFSYATYWSQGVWERSKNKEAAWGFLKFLAERTSLETLNKNIDELEGFQRPYPRPEMNIQFRDDSVLGSVVSLALDAKSWFLADNTHDGPTGINSQLKVIFEDMLSDWNPAGGDKKLKTLSDDIRGVLTKYTIPIR